MIPAPPGLVARFKSTGNGPGGTRTYYTDRRVYAFDDEGTPMIVSQEPARRLVPATQYSDYHGLVESGDDYIGLIPGGGWRWKEEGTDENGEQWVIDEPLVAWALRRDGAVIPLWAEEGYVTEARWVSDPTRAVSYRPDRAGEENTK